jgi:hypothetical protein
MKTKYLFLAALAGMTLVGCTSDDFIAEAPPVDNNEAMTPIVFSSLKSNFTRDDFTGAEAAEKLGNQFVVFGYKGEETGTPGVTVFNNYLVKYIENTANTTESNSNNWEYVLNEAGVPIKHAKDNGIVAQTIKYWDYSQPQYDFFAWSAGSKTPVYEGNPAAGQVLVSKMAATPETTTTDGVDKTSLVEAYTFTGKADDLSQVFISDLVTVKKDGSTAGKYGETVGYKEHPVTLKFRQLGTKVRIGIYETIPGYSVKNVEFYSAPASDDASAAAAKLFTTEANEIFTEGTYTVSFPTVDTPTDPDNNQAHIAFEPAKDGNNQVVAQKTTINWGELNYTIAELGEKSTDKIYLGRSSKTASFAGNPDDNYYVVYLPNQEGTNLNLRVNYTLESIDGSTEEITVKGATAQVPLIYTQWKPGYAYTYLFKISDKTNGFTGPYDPTHPDDATVDSNPAGLWPITFDAIVVNAEEDATQETITTVSAPSITTYQKGSEVVNKNEYLAATGPIFVTVNDGDTENTPDLANGKVVTLTTSGDGMAALYTLPTDKAYTEADVVAALQTQDDDAAEHTIKGRSGLVLTEAAFTLVDKIEYGVDGNTIDLTALPNGTNTYAANAMKFTAAAAGTYAFVYTKTAATAAGTIDKYQAVTKTVDDPATDGTNEAESVKGLYRNVLVAAAAGDVQKGVKYFEKNDASAGMITAFLGQGVGNLYLDENGNEIASGYAKTGTDYYYTTNNGMSYTKAFNLAFGSFATQELWVLENGVYTKKTETSPVDGTAYYLRTGDGTTDVPYVYTYCVILPQQTGGLYVLDEANYVECGDAAVAVDGIVYFDKYTKNDGAYYTKVIKVVQ